MSTPFTGFPAEGLAFLTELGRRDKAWFEENRSTYDQAVVAPTKAFVSAVGERLGDLFAPGIVAQPKANGSIAPINNDLRFAPDATPYKDHLMLRFWEGPTKKTAPMLMVHIGTDKVGFATGLMPADVQQWRDVIDSPTGEQLATAIATLAKAKKADVIGQELKKVPAPYDPDHARGDLLRHKALQVRWIEPMPAAVHKPAFVAWLTKRLEAAMPVHRHLVDAFT